MNFWKHFLRWRESGAPKSTGNTFSRAETLHSNRTAYIRNFPYADHPEPRDWQDFSELRDIPRVGNSGRHAEALQLINAALPNFSDITFVHLWHGIILQKLGRTDEARDVLLKALATHKKKGMLFRELGDLEFDHGVIEDALMWYVLGALSQLHAKRISSEGPFLYLAATAEFIGDQKLAAQFSAASDRGPQRGVDLSAEATRRWHGKLRASNSQHIKELISLVFALERVPT